MNGIHLVTSMVSWQASWEETFEAEQKRIMDPKSREIATRYNRF